MHFDLTDLRLYLNILDAGNITAGAARSHLSLAAASARIRALETSLGTPFFQRGRRGVTPTPAGKALAQHARLILQQSERLRQDLADYANGVKGQVRLLCNTTALNEYLPERLADFLREHPPIDIDLQELPSLRIVHAISQGAAELGIVSDAVDTRDLQTRPFHDDPLVLVIPRDHPLAEIDQPRFSDALRHEQIGLAASSALAVYLEEQALHLGLRLQLRIRVDSFDAVLRMVARGAGPGIVPQATLDRWPADARLLSRPLPEPWARRKLLLCARSFEHLPSYARTLVDALTPP
ncbi:LysR family transcriptional regulator [Pseudomonas gingeri]|uniref:LysR family transcriptional regulator n=1 Tax=Pseudomonas gingeri TaxID=117681 RepID=UPI00159FA529|nr:LysR family transcriptional regulator [Pseudomonas gingeri]NWE27796.1 LysR family transcriptional regulator [Pseudomonas gingeri]NWE97126.1 LysR family transcriptional regulator [Pseudomonas gingeri]